MLKYVWTLLLATPIWAQDVQPAPGGTGGSPATPTGPFGLNPMVMIALMVGVMYFLMIRPQQVQAKNRRKMLEALKKDDRIATSGGILGTIISLNDEIVTIKVHGGDARMELLRGAVSQVLSPDDVKPKKKS